VSLIAIKTEWVIVGGIVGLVALEMIAPSKKDRDGDGKADPWLQGWGFDIGSGVVGGVVGVLDGALDALADPFGGSYSDCQKAKAAGDDLGVAWACWPWEWSDYKKWGWGK